MALGALPRPAEKADVVRAMFDRIAPHYDRLNGVMTWRLDRRWRLAAIAAAALGPGMVAVDVACGTGDLAALAAATGARVVGVDFAAGMLAGARRRGVAAQLARADAAALPVATASADAVTCGFALRNFVAIPPMLAEAARVLRPGGRLVVLEVATPANRFVRWGHRLYFERVVPRLGAWLADEAAYAYLPQSVTYLPDPAALRSMMLRAGFRDVTRQALGAGAVQLLRARRADAP